MPEGLVPPEAEVGGGGKTAEKLIGETQPSNALMKRWAESAGTPFAHSR